MKNFTQKAMISPLAVGIDPKYLSKTMEIIDVSKYGIDFVEILMSGQTVTEHDCSTLIYDMSVAFSTGKIIILYDPNAGIYATVTGIVPDTQVSGSLLGSMMGIYIKADIVIECDRIVLFGNILEV